MISFFFLSNFLTFFLKEKTNKYIYVYIYIYLLASKAGNLNPLLIQNIVIWQNDFSICPKIGWKGVVKKLWLLLQQVISSLMVMIIHFSFSLTFPHYVSHNLENHPFSKITTLIGFDSMAMAWTYLFLFAATYPCMQQNLSLFWKNALLCYVVSEKDRAFSIWFCVGRRSTARLMGVTITCFTLFWLNSFGFNIVKYVSGVC